ncbi:Eco57I restriction-modification methylase domain-containing protein [Lacrimispora sp.]|uniref:Eco57I restriction-modification methylase domain-containing protein n=1 Tax=Lacrimispora sp. TaxID=2719234 RepID=UPI0039930026
MGDKETGSFYTPLELVKYMVEYVQKRVKMEYILEPSIGDGRFIETLVHECKEIMAIEIDREKVFNASNKWKNKVSYHCGDFIEYALNSNKKYQLIIGNPPYISKKNLNDIQRMRTLEILDFFSLPESLSQNLWVAFILASLKLLDSDGTIFFVLPFEFLQVQYAEKLRIFLESKFNTIEITTFKERVFEGIEQDICLVYLSNENNDKPYIQYRTIKNLSFTKPIFESIIKRNKPLKKWSNCILNDDETEFLKQLSRRYVKINDIGDISPGIVTGANSFFVCNRMQMSKLRMKNINLKIISKSADLLNRFIFTKDDFKYLAKMNKRAYLLNLNNIDRNKFTNDLISYIKTGEDNKINERYKCSIRARWYDVPIIRSGSVFFFKRYNHYPRIIINEANVYTTDIAYNIRFYDQYDSKSFAFCFYNSLTMALCEYNGRFYGGGVGELVPSEFKELRVPYKKIDEIDILSLDKMIRANTSFSEIINFVDDIVLDVSNEEKEVLHNIREKFIQRRLGKEDD